MIKKINKIIIVCLFFIIPIFLFNAVSCQQKERVIKIGIQTALSGDYKSYGQDQLISINMAAKKLAPVRIAGQDYMISIVSKDDEGSPEKAFLVSQELIQEDVAAVIGSAFNATTAVAVKKYEEYGIPMIVTSAQATELNRSGSNFFRLIINNSQKVENIANFISSSLSPKKLVLIDVGNEYSVNLTDYLAEILTSQEVEIFRRYSLKPEGNDFAIIAENLLIDEPDMVFFSGDYDVLAKLMTEAREAGVTAGFITEKFGMDDGISVLADHAYLEGLLAVIPEPPAISQFSENQKAISFWREYKEFASEQENFELTDPGPYAPYAYDAVNLIIGAMKKANSINPSDFMDELRQTSYEGVSGNIEFETSGDRKNPESTVFVMKNGTWVRF